MHTLIGEVTPADAPVLSLDVAILLVESALPHADATSGATREEVREAMEDLVHAREVVHIPDRDNIIIRRGHERSSRPSILREWSGHQYRLSP